MWALVYALGKARNRRGFTFASGNICYACFDPGGVAVKWHDVPDGYGVTGERVTDSDAYRLVPGADHHVANDRNLRVTKRADANAPR